MFFSLKEFIDAIIMIFAVGFIFSAYLRRYRPITIHEFYFGRIHWRDLRFAIAITAPAIILHELAHKFTALSFGLTATFHAAYLWLLIGIMLRLFGSSIIFFVPAYVSITGAANNLAYALIALAGPLTNLVIWLISAHALKKASHEKIPFLHLTKEINKFLFIFNMLPIPGFDGFQVYANLIKFIF